MNHLFASLLDKSVSLLGAPLSLVILSIVIGSILAIVFGFISPQEKVRAVKRKIGATILEAILYRHDTRVSLAAQGKLLGLATWYLLLALPPIIILLLPTLFVMGHFNEQYGYRLPRPGEQMIVQARTTSPSDLQLKVEGSFKATEPLHIASERAVAWRLDRISDATSKLMLGDSTIDLSTSRLAPLVSSNWLQKFLYPAVTASKLPASIEQIDFAFPPRYFNFLGHDFSWLTLFFLISLLSGYLTARMRGIAI